MLKGQLKMVAAGKAFDSKKGRGDLKRYEAALHGLQAAYDKLDPAIKPWFSLLGTEPSLTERELTKVKNMLPPAGTPSLTP